MHTEVLNIDIIIHHNEKNLLLLKQLIIRKETLNLFLKDFKFNYKKNDFKFNYKKRD